MYRASGGRGMRLSSSQRMPHGQLQDRKPDTKAFGNEGNKSLAAERTHNINTGSQGRRY